MRLSSGATLQSDREQLQKAEINNISLKMQKLRSFKHHWIKNDL